MTSVRELIAELKRDKTKSRLKQAFRRKPRPAKVRIPTSEPKDA